MNKYRGETDIVLDKPRTIRLTMNALAAFEEVVGKTWDAVLAELNSPEGESEGDQHRRFANVVLSSRKLRALLWAGLLWQERNLTIDRVGDLMELAPGDGTENKLVYIFGKLSAAYAGTRSESAKKNLQMEAEKLAVGTGVDSNGVLIEQASSQTSSGT